MSLAVADLDFAYQVGGDLILDRLSHDFAPAAVTAVTGPSGRGKSTLLYLVGLMLTPTAGKVIWDDLDASAWSDGERSRVRARRIGFVFQDAVLDPSRSVLDNVTEGGLYAGLASAESRARAQQLLSDFGVTARATHRPGEISGGQAQRVALCRALVKQPSVLLADEPSGNLDEASADVVWTALTHAAHDGTTIVVATHDRQRLRHADEVLTL